MIEEEKNAESIIDKNIDLSEDKNIENQDENDSEFKLTFKLENFSGPLDLLLTLIKKANLISKIFKLVI